MMQLADGKRISHWLTRLPAPETWLILWLLLGGLSVIEAKGKKKDVESEAYALLGGTCINEKGLSLPGVTIEANLQNSSEPKLRKKKWTTSTDGRGEFAVRLPAGKATFQVKASKKGYQSQEKTVGFNGDERQDLLFHMEPLPSKK